MRDYRTEYLKSYIDQKINQEIFDEQRDGDEFVYCSFTYGELEYFRNLMDLKKIYNDDLNDWLQTLMEDIQEVKESLQQYVGTYNLLLKQQVDLNFIVFLVDDLKRQCKKHMKE